MPPEHMDHVRGVRVPGAAEDLRSLKGPSGRELGPWAFGFRV